MSKAHKRVDSSRDKDKIDRSSSSDAQWSANIDLHSTGAYWPPNVEVPVAPNTLLGFGMPDGKEFIGRKTFLSWEDIFEEIALNKHKKILVSIGDSSTAGWNNDIIAENKRRLNRNSRTMFKTRSFLELKLQTQKEKVLSHTNLSSAFFSFRNYSDFLRDELNKGFVVINAGTPGYTSMLGRIKLEFLFKKFNQKNIKIDYVSTYFGNNDSFWIHNSLDKEWPVLRNKYPDKQVSFINPDKLATRVSPEDYQSAMEEIIGLCLKHNAVPLLIKPLVPIWWEPGKRDSYDKLPDENYFVNFEFIHKAFQEAHKIWQEALLIKTPSERTRLLELAKEKDFIVPRIKNTYVGILRKISKEYNVDLVDVEINRNKDDGRYFTDCCHPSEVTYKLLADGLVKVIHEWESGSKTFKDIRQTPSLLKKAKPRIDSDNITDLHIPSNQYTLY